MTVSFSSLFKKSIKKAPAPIRKKFVSRLDLFIEDPYNPLLNNHGLVGKFKGYRSINITGDWRAVYKQLDKNNALFSYCGTHSKLYK